MMSAEEPNLEKWAVTEALETKPAPRPLNSIKTLHKPSNELTKIDYNKTWINNELRSQLAYLISHPDIKSKIELYKEFDYSIRTFTRRRAKIITTHLTDDLQQKIDEILEARLVETGYTAKNWPFIIFLLKNNHGYRDVKDIDNNQSITFNVTRGAISSVSSKRKQINNTSTPVK